MEYLLEFGSQYQAVLDALPIHKEIIKLPRQYVANIICTIVGDPFEAWVQERIEARNAKVAEEQELMIELDPQVAEAFRNSTAISRKLLFDSVSLVMTWFNLCLFL